MDEPSGLQNDHKALMVDIEDALHKLHARHKSKPQREEPGQAEAMEQDAPRPSPFARVDGVTQGSPACRAVRLCLSVCLSVCPSVSVCQSVCPPVCLSVCLSLCPSVSLSDQL